MRTPTRLNQPPTNWWNKRKNIEKRLSQVTIHLVSYNLQLDTLQQVKLDGIIYNSNH